MSFRNPCHMPFHKLIPPLTLTVPFPRCTAGPNIAGSCCICFHTTANTDAATPNIPSHRSFGDAYLPLRSLSYDPLPLQNLVSHNFVSQ